MSDEKWEPKVVGIDGLPHPVNPRPEADALLISDLEDMLARARSGEITGYAYAQQNADGTVTHYWAGTLSSNYAIVGALEALQQQILARMFEADDD